jgi:1,4-dihydroxy-2-naphthoyl-CoA hydrolase
MIEALQESAEFELLELSGERVRATMVVGEAHHQPYGLVHGGVWTFVIETVASVGATAAVLDDGMFAAGVNNNTDFLRSVSTGKVEVVATPLHQGRSQQLWQAEISRESDGKLVARGQVRLQNLPRSDA